MWLTRGQPGTADQNRVLPLTAGTTGAADQEITVLYIAAAPFQG